MPAYFASFVFPLLDDGVEFNCGADFFVGTFGFSSIIRVIATLRLFQKSSNGAIDPLLYMLVEPFFRPFLVGCFLVAVPIAVVTIFLVPAITTSILILTILLVVLHKFILLVLGKLPELCVFVPTKLYARLANSPLSTTLGPITPVSYTHLTLPTKA